LESIAEARINNVSFETKVSDVGLNNENKIKHCIGIKRVFGEYRADANV